MPFPGKGGDKGGLQVYGRLHTTRPHHKEAAVARPDSTRGTTEYDTYWGNAAPDIHWGGYARDVYWGL